jgi:hypothetical protein
MPGATNSINLTVFLVLGPTPTTPRRRCRSPTTAAPSTTLRTNNPRAASRCACSATALLDLATLELVDDGPVPPPAHRSPAHGSPAHNGPATLLSLLQAAATHPGVAGRGVREFRSELGLTFDDPPRSEAYDASRELAHRLCARLPGHLRRTRR